MKNEVTYLINKSLYKLFPSDSLFLTHTPKAFFVGKILNAAGRYYDGYIITKIVEVAPTSTIYGKMPCYEVYGKALFENFFSNAAANRRGDEQAQEEDKR